MKNINDKKISFKNKNIIFILFLLTSTFIFSCEKEPPNYREKWIGLYDCTITSENEVAYALLTVTPKGYTMIHLEFHLPDSIQKYDVIVDSLGNFHEGQSYKPYHFVQGFFAKDLMYMRKTTQENNKQLDYLGKKRKG